MRELVRVTCGRNFPVTMEIGTSSIVFENWLFRRSFGYVRARKIGERTQQLLEIKARTRDDEQVTISMIDKSGYPRQCIRLWLESIRRCVSGNFVHSNGSSIWICFSTILFHSWKLSHSHFQLCKTCLKDMCTLHSTCRSLVNVLKKDVVLRKRWKITYKMK